MRNKIIELVFVASIALMANQSFGAELSVQPLRSLDLKETLLKINANLKFYLMGTQTILQKGQVIFNLANIDQSAPYCILSNFGADTFIDVLSADLYVEILKIEGQYSDENTAESGVFKTAMTLNAVGGSVTFICQKPSPLNFNEVTIGELVEAGGEFINFENLGLTQVEEQQELGLTPALIFQPEKELQNIPGARVDAKLGATIFTDLAILPAADKAQAAWVFTNGLQLTTQFQGLNQKRCALEMLSEIPVALSKGQYLSAKSIRGQYRKDVTMPSSGLGAAGFETQVELASDAFQARLTCTANSMQPLTYNQSQTILGKNLAWSLMEQAAYPQP